MENEEKIIPERIWQADQDTLAIRWLDRHESTYASRFLRSKCQCAVCVDELSGETRLRPGSVAEDIQPRELESVGRYGLRIHWSDGHKTGIYSFDFLRTICPCSECKAKET
ncbi:MAG: hypothetical protein A3A73_04780 [Omnitrophica bacterium RIFCSPLOWO2_01_FULL_50_24]|nr:MAG: hypothetical protein A3A73_04780 [Omnitrophica bacterium RIFCSPLOWO2_01_FULL_50_24]